MNFALAISLSSLWPIVFPSMNVAGRSKSLYWLGLLSDTRLPRPRNNIVHNHAKVRQVWILDFRKGEQVACADCVPPTKCCWQSWCGIRVIILHIRQCDRGWAKILCPSSGSWVRAKWLLLHHFVPGEFLFQVWRERIVQLFFLVGNTECVIFPRSFLCGKHWRTPLITATWPTNHTSPLHESHQVLIALQSSLQSRITVQVGSDGNSFWFLGGLGRFCIKSTTLVTAD